MTRREWNHTVQDLVGDDRHLADGFVPEEEGNGFTNNADALVVTQLLAEQYLNAADAVSTRATEDLPGLLQCDPTAGDEEACVRGFLGRFGKRAYRRPLTPEEESNLMALYVTVRRDGAAVREGVEAILQAMLQSPHFLYRVEVGPLDGWALASRLSYFLWGTMPDDELFAEAEAGRLTTAAEVEAQARRMVDDPRTRETVRDFHDQWLRLTELDQLEKDPTVYPTFDPTIAALLRREAETFVDYVVWDGEGDLGALLSAPYTFLDQPLANFYGIPGPSGEGFLRVDLPDRASGLLSQGGLLALLAKPNQTSPIHRGKFVRERLLCDVLPPPPEGIVITPPEPDPSLPTRERFAAHSSNSACAGCHALMDPIGFGFEHFDGVGRWRDVENGFPIDATGHIEGSDVEGDFDGVTDLGNRLAGSEQVRACVVRQWFRYAYGRSERDEDVCTLERLGTAFDEAGLQVKELLIALTQTDAFLSRRVEGGSP
jgi:hypothetical protein